VAGKSYLSGGIQMNSGDNIDFGNSNQYITGVNNTSLTLATGGSATLTATHAGNVGIGTTSPSEKLDVAGSVRVGNMKFEPINGGRIGFNRNTTTGAIYNSDYAAFQINGAYSGADFLAIESYNSLGVFQGVVSIKEGNVGIGTTSPDQKLHVSGNAKVTGVIYTDYIQTLSGTSIDFRHQDASTVMRVDTANERVGIGTTSPASILDIGGNIRFTNGSTDNYITTDSDASAFRIFGGSTNSVSNGAALTLHGHTKTSDAGIADLAASSIGSVRFRTGTTERMRITSSGNVGIGTTSPGAKLEVNGDSSYSSDYNFLSISGTKTGGTAVTNVKGIDLSIGSGDIVAGNDIANLYGAYINNNTSGGSASVIGNWYGVYVPSADADRVSNRVSAYFGDNVGIGTTSPNVKLHVLDGPATLKLQSSNYYPSSYIDFTNITNTLVSRIFSYSNPGGSGLDLSYEGFGTAANSSKIQLKNGLIYLHTAGSSRVVINSSGNVGIGTTSTTHKLDVNGTGRFTGNITLGGVPATSTGSFEYLTRNTSTGVVEKVSAPKVYVALLGQTGTSAPSATIIQNTLSGTPVWSRESTGIYVLTLASEFTANKTTVLMNNSVVDTALTAYSNSVNTVAVSTKIASTNVAKDGALFNATIRIEVYP
jgi:hypothetical protein